MSRPTCLSCPYFVPWTPEDPKEGNCQKEPPKVVPNSIGTTLIGVHPQVKESTIACGAHPQVMMQVIGGLAPQVGDRIIGLYESMLPRFVKLALEAGDKMEAAEKLMQGEQQQ